MHQLDFLLATLICVKSNFRPNIKWPSYHMPIAFGFTNNRKFSIINMLSIYQLSYSTLNLVSSNVNDVTIIRKIVCLMSWEVCKVQTQPCALTFTSKTILSTWLQTILLIAYPAFLPSSVNRLGISCFVYDCMIFVIKTLKYCIFRSLPFYLSIFHILSSVHVGLFWIFYIRFL